MLCPAIQELFLEWFFVCCLKVIELYQFLFLTSERNKYILFLLILKTENQTIPISIRRKHSLSVSYILCVELLVLLETQMQLIF